MNTQAYILIILISRHEKQTHSILKINNKKTMYYFTLSAPAGFYKIMYIYQLRMSSVKNAKLKRNASTLVKRSRLSDSHLGYHTNTMIATYHFRIHLTLPTDNSSSRGTPFHLPVSISKWAVPPLSIIRALLWLFSFTLTLTLKKFHTQNSNRKVWVCCPRLQPNLPPYIYTPHSSTSFLFSPLKPQPEWHSYNHANHRDQNFCFNWPLLTIRGVWANLSVNGDMANLSISYARNECILLWLPNPQALLPSLHNVMSWVKPGTPK